VSSWHQFLCFRYSAPPMAPVFMFLVLCSTDDASFYVLGILLHRWHQFSCFRCSAPSGAEYRKHENWCHQWNRVPKTWKLVSSVEQSTENIKTGVISGAEYRKHENWCRHQYSCFRFSVPPMTPIFMFSVFCSTDGTSFHVFGILLQWWHQFSCFRYSVPLMTPVFMFSVFYSTDNTSFHVFGTLFHWWHQFSCFLYSTPLMTPVFYVFGTLLWCHRWSRIPKT
jgi:hypothetical protein